MNKDINVTIKLKVPREYYEYYEHILEDFEFQLGEINIYIDTTEED